MIVMLFKVKNTYMLILCESKDTHSGSPLATEDKKRAKQATPKGSIARRILTPKRMSACSLGLSMALLFIHSVILDSPLRKKTFGTIRCYLNPVLNTHSFPASS